MKRFNRIFAVCLTLSVLGGVLLPNPTTCDGFSQPLPIEVQAEGETGTTDTGIGVLITMLLANGIRFVGDFNDTVKPGIEKLWEDFTTETGNTITLATLGAQSIVQLGYLRTSSAVNNAVASFQAWYQNTFNVPNSGNVTVSIPGAVAYQQVPYSYDWVYLTGSSGAKWYKTTNADLRTIILTEDINSMTANNTILYFVSTVSDIELHYGYNGSGYSSINRNSSTVNGVTYYYGQVASGSYFLNFIRGYYSAYPDSVIQVSNRNNYNTAISYTYGADAGIGDISMTGQSLDLIDGYDISNDQAKLIDLAGIESLVGVLGLTLENVNDLIDSIPLIMDYPWAESFPDDPTYADTPVDAIPWVDAPTAVVPAEVPEYVPETPADEGSYKVLGLERVFPFSIPFDFIAVVNLLNAEPVCPEFTFRVYNPISRQNIDATMSFERFEAVAQVIRIAETIGFIVFLILITRSLIRS